MLKKEMQAEIDRLRFENASLIAAIGNMSRPVQPNIQPYHPWRIDPPWNHERTPNMPSPYYTTWCGLTADGEAM